MWLKILCFHSSKARTACSHPEPKPHNHVNTALGYLHSTWRTIDFAISRHHSVLVISFSSRTKYNVNFAFTGSCTRQQMAQSAYSLNKFKVMQCDVSKLPRAVSCLPAQPAHDSFYQRIPQRCRSNGGSFMSAVCFHSFKLQSMFKV